MVTYYHPGILDHLIRWGLDVEVIPGWETRGVRNLATGARMPFNPRGALAHWTAGPKTGERPSLRICLNGRPGIPGPLPNVFLGRASVVLVAAGRANHAGRGERRGLTSASQLWGTEAEDDGSNGWTDFQRWAYPRINAAYSTYSGFDETWHFSHAEFALPRGRKVDINGYTMDDMRRQVGALLRNGPKAPVAPLATPIRDVHEIQVALAVLGYYDVGPALEYLDGDPGPSFRAAVIAYQGDRSHALKADGLWLTHTDRYYEEHDMAGIVDQIAAATAAKVGHGIQHEWRAGVGDRTLYDLGNDVRKIGVDTRANTAALLKREGVDVDESAIVAGVLEGLSPEAIAAAIPGSIATEVADELARRIGAAS